MPVYVDEAKHSFGRLDSDGSVTELKPEEREALAWMRDDLYKVVDEIPTPKVPKAVRLAALTAALSLASPFTREEWGDIRACVYNHGREWERSEDVADLIAKLDAMLAQSSPANRELDGVDAPADNSGLHRP